MKKGNIFATFRVDDETSEVYYDDDEMKEQESTPVLKPDTAIVAATIPMRYVEQMPAPNRIVIKQEDCICRTAVIPQDVLPVKPVGRTTISLKDIIN